MNTTRPKTPELDKLRAAKEDLDYVSLSNFLDWLKANGWEITSRDPTHPVPTNFDQLFARYAQIDMSKIDTETKALVDWHGHARVAPTGPPAAPLVALAVAAPPPLTPKEDP